MALVNGKEYSYVNLQFSLLGNTNVKGVKSISYKIAKESENLYGAGDEPVAYGDGEKTYEGEIQLMRKEINAIRRAIGNGTLVDIPPFSIVVAFANGTDPITTETLRYVRFLEDGLEGAQGDKELPFTIPLAIGGIKFNQ